MGPNVIFRVDGGSKMGLGHLIRCIALGNMLKMHFNITFYCRKIPANTIVEIRDSGFNFHLLESEDFFFEKINSGDIVVLDGYQFTAEYQSRIKSLNCILVCIDDIHEMEFKADLIINHSPGIVTSDYKAEAYTQFALGVEYALIRPPFLEQAKKQRHIDKIDTVLICFGGSDYKNLTQSTLEILNTIDRFKRIIVITGSAFSQLDLLRTYSVKNNRIRHYHAVNQQQMLELILQSDLAIVPASGILLEVLSVGIKVISGYYIDNQKVVFENLKNMGAFQSAAAFDDRSLRTALDNVFRDIHCQVPKIIDGKSDKRNLNIFLDLKSTIRIAELNDCEMLFGWVNESEVRENAINQNIIEWDCHVKWFTSKLRSIESRIYILEFNKNPIGQIRYEEYENHWLISYSIIKSHRGIGFGKLILKKTLPFFKNKIIKAVVNHRNIASQKVFLSAGFNKISDEIIKNECFFTFEYIV